MTIPAPTQRFILPDMPTADEILPYLRQIDENRWYSNFGPLAYRFEQAFANTMAQVHQAPHPHNCVMLSSGYHALSIGLSLLGLKEGATVLIPSVTFPACPLAVLNRGANVLLADIDPESWQLTPAIARAAAHHHKIDAVMPVCLYGMASDSAAWDRFTADTNIPVLIDAAAAVETQTYPQKGLVAHSLHALKPFGIGEGGLLISPDPEMAIRAHHESNFGMQDRITYHGGENAKASEYHAAVALAQLDRWPAVKARRRHILNLYQQALSKEPRVQIHSKLQETIPSCLMISFFEPLALGLFSRLSQRGMAVHRTYLPPLYDHPHFQALPLVDQNGKTTPKAGMTGALHMDTHVLGLPFHAFMTTIDIENIVTLLSECLDTLTLKKQSHG